MASRQSQYSPQPYQELRIPVTNTSGSVNYILPFNTLNQPQRIICESEGDDMVYKFGNSTVAASTAVDGTLKTLPKGNFSVTNGHVVETDIPSDKNLNYVSIQSLSSTGGTGIIRLCELLT